MSQSKSESGSSDGEARSSCSGIGTTFSTLLKFPSANATSPSGPVSPVSPAISNCKGMETAGSTSLEDHREKNSNSGEAVAASPLQQPEGPPDAGWDAWLTIAGAWMVQFCTFGYINAFGVYQDYYTREFLTNRTASDISWIGSVQLFLQYAPGVFVGRAFDKGYFHHIMILGSLIYVFSMFMVSLTQPGQYYQVFLSQALGMGIGQGMLFLPSLTIVSHHFKRRRALAIGIVVSGAACGGIAFPIMLNTLSRTQLAPRHANENVRQTAFANAVRISAGTVAALLIIANCIMKTRGVPISIVGTPAGWRKSRNDREMAATAKRLAQKTANGVDVDSLPRDGPLRRSGMRRPNSPATADFVEKRMSAMEQRISFLENRLSVAENGGIDATLEAAQADNSIVVNGGGGNHSGVDIVTVPRPGQNFVGARQGVDIGREEEDALPAPVHRPRPTATLATNPTATLTLPKPDLRAILTDVAYGLSMAAAFCINLGIFFPYFYIQLYAIEKGVNPTVAFYALTILNAASCLGRVVPNFLADRLGVYNNLCVSLFASAILLFSMLAVDTWVGVVVFVVLYGFASGAYVALIPSLLGQLCTHLGELGIRMGIAFSVVAVAMLVGTPVAGGLLNHAVGRFIWWKAIVYSGIMVTSGAALMTISRFVFIRRRKTGQLV